jgi:hypothetical protein
VITAVFQVPGTTAAQYDGIIRDLEKAGEGAPDGRLYHVSSGTLEGWFIVDVWESAEQLGRFADVLMPIVAKNGVTPPPPRSTLRTTSFRST